MYRRLVVYDVRHPTVRFLGKIRANRRRPDRKVPTRGADYCFAAVRVLGSLEREGCGELTAGSEDQPVFRGG